jgi:VWFA-related protein
MEVLVVRTICLLLFSACVAAAQDSSPSSSPQVAADAKDISAPYTITVNTRLVLKAVSVKDKKGSPVKGLTAGDFIVTEDGKVQKVSVCEFQDLDSDTARSAAVTAGLQPNPVGGNPSSAMTTATELQYRDHRLIAMYFDMASMPVSDQLRALNSAQTFVDTQMRSPDMVSILTFSGAGVRVEHDFTGDRNALLQTLHALLVGEGQGQTGDANDASSSDTGAAFGQNDSEFNIFNTDRQLSALQTAASMLGRLRQKKVLLYFASGLSLNGLNNQAQLQATINSAIRSGVSLWPIDARGLVAQSPLGDATVGAPGGAAMYSGVSAAAVSSNLDRSQDTLWTLAADTGGKALLNYNDLSRGIVQAQQSVSSYYIIGYYSSNAALDGRYRHLRITLNGDTTASLDYQPGYFAGKKFNAFTTEDKERQLEEALMLGDPMTELTVAMELNYFQINRAEYFVPLTVKIPGRELSLARKGGAQHTLIDFIGEIKDQFGATVANLRDKIDVKLTDVSAAELSKQPIAYEAGFTLFPGRYTIKFLARDAETGRIGTYQTKFVIPNLNNEQEAVRMSSVVLAGQRTEKKDALYASKKGSGEVANPLVAGTQSLIPSVTRVFHTNRPMYVYLQAYQDAVKETMPSAAFVTLYRDDAKRFESSMHATSSSMTGTLKKTPLQLTIPAGTLPAGRYICQITVLDPTDHKVTFWRTPLVLVP